MSTLLTLQEFAYRAAVDPGQLRKLIQLGRLRPARKGGTGPGHGHQFEQAFVDMFCLLVSAGISLSAAAILVHSERVSLEADGVIRIAPMRKP